MAEVRSFRHFFVLFLHQETLSNPRIYTAMDFYAEDVGSGRSVTLKITAWV